MTENAPVPDVEDSINTTGLKERPIILNTKPLFKLMVDKRASDLFFTSYAPIKIKIEGKIMSVNKQMLTPDVVRHAAYGLMTQEQIEHFSEELEIVRCAETRGGREVADHLVAPRSGERVLHDGQ